MLRLERTADRGVGGESPQGGRELGAVVEGVFDRQQFLDDDAVGGFALRTDCLEVGDQLLPFVCLLRTEKSNRLGGGAQRLAEKLYRIHDGCSLVADRSCPIMGPRASGRWT